VFLFLILVPSQAIFFLSKELDGSETGKQKTSEVSNYTRETKVEKKTEEEEKSMGFYCIEVSWHDQCLASLGETRPPRLDTIYGLEHVVGLTREGGVALYMKFVPEIVRRFKAQSAFFITCI